MKKKIRRKNEKKIAFYYQYLRSTQNNVTSLIVSYFFKEDIVSVKDFKKKSKHL